MLAVALLSALAGYAAHRSADRTAHLPDDTVAALVAHLEQRNFHLHVIADSHGGDICAGAFLSRTFLNWDQVSTCGRFPERLPERLPGRLHWQGTIHVKPSKADVRAWALAHWKESCLVYGQLVLFGDPELLAEVRAALQE
jgi:hypothetical protein